MIFKETHEAYDWFRNYKPFNDKIEMYHGKDVKFGDWILFQHIKSKTISRPILGICTGFNVWDMALVMSIVEPIRSWMYTHDIITNPKNNYKMKMAFLDAEVQNFPIWTENIHKLGHWKQKPTFNQLKECFNNKL